MSSGASRIWNGVLAGWGCRAPRRTDRQPTLERFQADDERLALAGLAAFEQAADAADGAGSQRSEQRLAGRRQAEHDGAAVVRQAAHPLDQAAVLQGVGGDRERRCADFERLGKLAGAVARAR